MITRKDIAAVILSLADRPLHYDADLNYIAEVVRGEESKLTPWFTIGRDVSQSPDIFRRTDDGIYDLNISTNINRKMFVISKIGQDKFDKIFAMLKAKNFISIDGKLQWTPHSHYRHLISDTYITHENKKENDWYPVDYDPGFSVEKWIELINDPEVFNTASLKVMKRMLDQAGEATCTELANKYGSEINFYNKVSSALAERIVKKTNCPVQKRKDGSPRWWTVLYLGKNAGKDDAGSYLWKLRPELAEALKQVDLSEVKLYADEQPVELSAENIYSKEDFLAQVFMTSEKYDALVRMLKHKKNIILQGAPGVGKTFAAKRLAYSIMGEKDENRIEFVQFHQNYSYEDFVMGYKPNENGFKLTEGIFYSFCQKAASEPERDYFFVIDEINRGNMSKIFGELLMLIEKDYRGNSMKLAYSDTPFRVPKNLHIIGMMNTADRSLAMIDYALRRRFSFFDMEPGFESDGFKAYQAGLNSEKLNKLVDEIKSLNNAIIEDKSLGKGFCIGHSYLCGAEMCSDKWLQGIVEYDILPMLAEYWFDELDKYEEWKKRLTDVFK